MPDPEEDRARMRRVVFAVAVPAIAASIGWAVWVFASAHDMDAGEEAGVISIPVLVITLVLAGVPPYDLLRTRSTAAPEAAAILAARVLKRSIAQRHRLLGQDTVTINVSFDRAPSTGRSARNAAASGDMNGIVEYFEALRPRRLIITGEAGSGKTALMTDLIVGLLENRSSTDPVPLLLPVADWDMSKSLPDWIADAIVRGYGMRPDTARTLVAEDRILPMFDGVDEMDAQSTKPADSRALLLLKELNKPQSMKRQMPFVLTCRSSRATQLKRQLRVLDAAEIIIRPVSGTLAADYLQRRSGDPELWRPLCVRLMENAGAESAGPAEPAASAITRYLSTPWRLNLAFTVFEPGDPRKILTYADIAKLEAELLSRFVPASLEGSPYRADRVHQWLHAIAAYLQRNGNGNGDGDSPRSLGGRQLPTVEIVPQELWPMLGEGRVPAVDGLFNAVCALPFACVFVQAFSFGSRYSWNASILVACLIALLRLRRQKQWPPLRRWDLHQLRTKSGWRVIAVIMAAAMCISLLFIWEKALPLGEALWFGAAYGAAMSVTVGLRVRRLPDDLRGMVLDPVAALRADRTAGLLAGIGAALTLGLTVGYRLAAHEAHTPTSRALVMAGCAAAAFVFAFTAVANGWMRYAVILALSRRTLPARFGRFLRHAEAAGLLRIEGMAYQFRHRELQEWLAAHQTPTVAGTSVVGG